MFDLDDTLILTNHAKDKQDQYYSFAEWKINEKIFARFRQIQLIYPTYVMTARSPKLKEIIAERLQISANKIICRDFWDNRIFIRFILKYSFLKHKFNKKSVEFKIQQISQLPYDRIYLIDDFHHAYPTTEKLIPLAE